MINTKYKKDGEKHGGKVSLLLHLSYYILEKIEWVGHLIFHIWEATDLN